MIRTKPLLVQHKILPQMLPPFQVSHTPYDDQPIRTFVSVAVPPIPSSATTSNEISSLTTIMQEIAHELQAPSFLALIHELRTLSNYNKTQNNPRRQNVYLQNSF